MPTKPNVKQLAKSLRKAADELDLYDELEPKRPSQEVWNVLTYAMLYADAGRDDRESMGLRLIAAVRKYREAEGHYLKPTKQEPQEGPYKDDGDFNFLGHRD